MHIKRRIARGLVAMTALLPAGALAEGAKPALSADEIAAMLDQGSDGNIAFSAEAIAEILDTSPVAGTRGLNPGEGVAEPEPGAKGSGVIPDLQITFATGSAQISAEAQQQLGAVARAMQFPRLENMRFEIAGHTDARGSDQMNQLLSQRRAVAVMEFLTQEYSIGPHRLRSVGYGEAQLVDPVNPASGKNRRVEIRTD